MSSLEFVNLKVLLFYFNFINECLLFTIYFIVKCEFVFMFVFERETLLFIYLILRLYGHRLGNGLRPLDKALKWLAEPVGHRWGGFGFEFRGWAHGSGLGVKKLNLNSIRCHS